MSEANPPKVTKPKRPRNARKAAKEPKNAVVGSWTFPKNSLEETLRVPKTLDEKFAGNPTSASELVKAVGFNKENDWRYLDLLRSSSLYGLTSGTGVTAKVSLLKLAEDILSPGNPEQRQSALLSAFRSVPDFASVADFYRGKKIPEDEFFTNTLIRQFNIPRDRVQVFAEVFSKNLDFLKASE